jgi:hypothetical protein
MDEESVTGRASYARFGIGVENRDYHHLSQNETNLVYLAARRKRHRPVAGFSEDFNKTFEEAFSAGCDPRGFGQARQDGPLLSYYR